MRTFLDENQIFGSTFLLYGNINDDFYCPDASIRKMDQYLNTFLKSRGYEHIIFFGTGGTRGAYCLDSVSARFFFDANHGIPGPEDAAPAPSRDQAEAAAAPAGGNSVGSMVRSGRKRRRYTAGALSEGRTAEPAAAQAADMPAAPAPGPEAVPAPPPRVTYALKRMDVAEFYAQFREKMMDPGSRMAIVFYNVLTDSGSANSIFLPSLKDDILHNFSQMGDQNLCLIIAPDTMSNTCDLQNLLRSNGLGGKFLMSAGDSIRSEFVFNPECCMQLGYPGRDEIENMLHRFAVVGTSRRRRIHFRYGQLRQIAERILANASVTAQQEKNTDFRKMRTIARITEDYIHSHAHGPEPLEITAETADRIWNIHADPNEALNGLNRRGWEPARQAVQRALRTSRNAVRHLTPRAEPRSSPDIALERYARQSAAAGPRPPIPNFIICGSPGTGKTEIARLIGRILYAEGILKVGHTVEVNREKLTDPHVAGVPKATMAQVDRADEGILFIDEAHSLGLKDGGANHSGTGVEVVSTLNAAITDPNRHFCVILAGYRKQMKDVFELDPGFRSRFKYEIDLEDYTPDLLYPILLEKIRSFHCEPDPELIREHTADNGQPYIPLKTMVERIYDERDREKFGNARAMKELAEHAIGYAEDDTVLTRESFFGGAGGTVTGEYFYPSNLKENTDQILAQMAEQFVGMKNVKQMLLDISLRIKRALSEGHTPDDIPLEPIVLMGNAGAGKTTVAETLAKIYYSYGILGTPEPVVRSASDFASEHAGGAQNAVRAAIREAQNRKAFLFVDEAHQLCDRGFDGAGALRTFMAPLTDRAHPFLACFGIYPHRKDAFLALDPGSRSRFENNLIPLEDYTPDELYEIFTRAMKRGRYTASAETLDLVRQLMAREYETRTAETGNARHALNILEQMKRCLNLRCHTQGISLDDPESRHFLPQDIPAALSRGLSAGSSSARLAQLDELERQLQTHRVGNEELKAVLKDLLSSRRIQLRYPGKAAGIIEPGHYFFKGNAGTGKTTSLRFIAEFLCQLGIIKDPKPVKVTASNLIGQYLGETGIKTRELLEQNMGRVIMIDEAYALSDPSSHANSYKLDAINEIVAKLDDETFRKTTCVVFAGYDGAMDAVYAQNQGLKSRVKEIAFPDFTESECISILQSMLDQENTPLIPDALGLCSQQIARMRLSPAFSNGRTLREYVRLLIQRRNDRILAAAPEEERDPELFSLHAEDVPPIGEVLRRLNL